MKASTWNPDRCRYHPLPLPCERCKALAERRQAREWLERLADERMAQANHLTSLG